MSQQQWKAPEGEEDVQMPLGTGGGEEAPMEEYSSGPRLKVNTSTMALVASFAAALVVLYFLGLQNKPRAASAEEVLQAQTIDSQLRSWLDRHGGQTSVEGQTESEKLFASLQRYFNQPSNTIEDLAGNPFAIEEKVAKIDNTNNQVVIVPKPVPEPPDPELVEAAKEFAGLKLEMVMVGSPSSALINKQIVSVGSRFKYLVVADIQPDQVILSFKDKTYSLKRNSPTLGGK